MAKNIYIEETSTWLRKYDYVLVRQSEDFLILYFKHQTDTNYPYIRCELTFKYTLEIEAAFKLNQTHVAKVTGFKLHDPKLKISLEMLREMKIKYLK